MVEVNLLGTFQVTQVFGERMAARGGGSIINIGSLYASVSPDPHFYEHLAGNAPFIKSPAYGASKAGVVNLSKFFATHWAGRGVRVNTLSPGGVLAGQDEQFKAKYGARVPLRRMADAEDLKGPLDVSRFARLVLRHRPRAARRRRLHRVVTADAGFQRPSGSRPRESRCPRRSSPSCIFVALHLTTGRLEVGNGAGWDGIDYARDAAARAGPSGTDHHPAIVRSSSGANGPAYAVTGSRRCRPST